MNDTYFKNCHGIDEDGHIMSAYDIALLSKNLLNNYPEVTKYTTIYMDSLRDGKSSLVNTNKLVRNYSGCTGLKTGSTSLALYNLAASASRDGLDLIAVVMKAPSSKLRFKNAASLLDYGFSNFQYKKLISKNDTVKTVTINKGIQPSINAISSSDLGVTLPKGQDVAIEQTISIPENLNAPISQGQIMGTLTYTLNGKTISECDLLANEAVSKINLLSMGKHLLNNWFSLLRK